MTTANDILGQARKLVGIVEGTASHHALVDLYNKTKPLPVGYKVPYLDDWCAVFVSVVGIKAGVPDLYGRECGVQRYIDIFKKKGIWEENGSVTPKAGWIICFNWDDSTQSNDGWADHIGFVESVKNGVITTIEGNYGDQVKRRYINVGWGYIRGYAKPNYSASSSSNTGDSTSTKKSIETIAKECIAGKWGNGDARVSALTKAGYNVKAVQAKIDIILKGTSANTPANPFANIATTGHWDTAFTKALQQYYGTTVDGVISGQVKGSWNAGIKSIQAGTGGSQLIRAMQKDLGVTPDGSFGPGSIKAAQKKAGTTQDGVVSYPSNLVKKMQQNFKSKGKPW